MAVWLVRAGSNGEREQYALDYNVAVIGYDTVPDMSLPDGADQEQEAELRPEMAAA